jgi:sarcosine/dimethylglycine N-methyltransferase
LDLTASRVAGAQALTKAARLGAQVDFVHGNALDMPFDPAQFTCIISQEAFAHIPRKNQLIAACARVLKPGGRMVFSDIMSHQALTAPDAQQLYDGMRFSEIATLVDYQQWFEQVGMRWVRAIDLSAEWTRILVDRHAMYRSLKDATVARLGQAHFDRYDAAYDHFVGLYQSGVLSGAWVVVAKD